MNYLHLLLSFNYISLLLHLISTPMISHLYHLLFSFYVTLIIGIFYCLNYTSLLLHLIIRHLENTFYNNYVINTLYFFSLVPFFLSATQKSGCGGVEGGAWPSGPAMKTSKNVIKSGWKLLRWRTQFFFEMKEGCKLICVELFCFFSWVSRKSVYISNITNLTHC